MVSGSLEKYTTIDYLKYLATLVAFHPLYYGEAICLWGVLCYWVILLFIVALSNSQIISTVWLDDASWAQALDE